MNLFPEQFMIQFVASSMIIRVKTFHTSKILSFSPYAIQNFLIFALENKKEVWQH